MITDVFVNKHMDPEQYNCAIVVQGTDITIQELHSLLCAHAH